MTTPPAAPTRPPFARILIAGLFLWAAYFWSWWNLIHLDPPIDPAASALGALTLPGVVLAYALHRNVWLHLLTAGIIFGLLWCVPEAWGDDYTTGLSVFIVVGWTIYVGFYTVNGFRAGWREARAAQRAAAAQEKRLIIGLSGYAGAGKDTAAKALLADGWVRVSFADKLREFAYELNPIVEIHDSEDRALFRRLRDLVDTYGWDAAKNNNPDVRALLQRLGTECGRNLLGENVWVDAVMANLPDKNIVVTDCRFENEARAIVAAGGHVIRLGRPGKKPVNPHPSETALDEWPFDGYLVNDSTPEALGVELRKVIEGLTDPA